MMAVHLEWCIYRYMSTWLKSNSNNDAILSFLHHQLMFICTTLLLIRCIIFLWQVEGILTQYNILSLSVPPLDISYASCLICPTLSTLVMQVAFVIYIHILIIYHFDPN